MIKDNGLINQADTANLLNITKESMNPPFYIIPLLAIPLLVTDFLLKFFYPPFIDCSESSSPL